MGEDGRSGTDLSARMRAWRGYFGLSQVEAAGILKVSRSTWQRWEANSRSIPYREWQRVKAAMEDWYRVGKRPRYLHQAPDDPDAVPF